MPDFILARIVGIPFFKRCDVAQLSQEYFSEGRGF